MEHRGFNKEPKPHKSLWESLMDMDLTLEDGTKVKLKDNIKSVTLKGTKKIKNDQFS